MCPRSSIPRVTSRFLKMPSRSSRSRPASWTSRSELTGSASLAIALQLLPPVGFHRPMNCSRSTRYRLYHLARGQGRRLAPRGTSQDTRRLGGLLPRLRLRAALLRRVGTRASLEVPAVRGRNPLPLPQLQRPLQLSLRRRLRIMWHQPPPRATLRRPNPQVIGPFGGGRLRRPEPQRGKRVYLRRGLMG